MSALRIAILAHSTNPRGGVVHALELADALVKLGHEPVVHAPDAKRTGFFRESLCETVSVPASPVGSDITEMVEIRAADYVRHFENPAHRRFDVFHAQDGISGNALATLKQRQSIAGFARTVHHIDAFRDPKLQALQTRAIVAADRHFTVSRMWQAELKQRHGIASVVVGNGVDTGSFTPNRDGREAALRERHGIGVGPVILAVGGIEARKNTIRLLEAFTQLHVMHPHAQLVIAGGATLLDHHDYKQAFAAARSSLALPAHAVIETGPVLQQDMPALYRLADVLAFPSVKEGFGLVVLEAMASGVPVIVSRIAPFTEHLRDEEVVWCDPMNAGSIVNALATALTPELAGRLRSRGPVAARRHDWGATAAAHIETYQALRERTYA
ncbi:MSMEG_0565 family glycosyltransferase [Starkeya sp. ORNL1]|uniref:MSMEG_0565 family glycosyltransferase n=1 Tax=Starkeya sp. ORNL1 TaxID=2709380 RepID=UPI001463E60E|nr:MSMEG_0565 family glycosyltransferase [Starkeya sp. ORNL1]QJP15594.1 MSMEG_0565 family glycosyltransferase [Starkeya sp. ORNL1]